MKNWLFSDGKQKLLEGFCCISMGWVVKVESKKKSAAMKWFPLHKTKVLGGAPDISLGQKYLTTADPFDPNYNTPDQHRDLKKLTCPSIYLSMYLCFIETDFKCYAKKVENCQVKEIGPAQLEPTPSPWFSMDTLTTGVVVALQSVLVGHVLRFHFRDRVSLRIVILIILIM